MGRVKLEIKKIESSTARQVTYSKRQNGSIKKAYELFVLCDVDVGVIMFSPSRKLTRFCNDEIENVLTRFVSTPSHERTPRRFENVEILNNVVLKLNNERNLDGQPGMLLREHNLEVQDLTEELKYLQHQKEIFDQKIGLYKGHNLIGDCTSMDVLQCIEKEVLEVLGLVLERQMHMDISGQM